MAFNNANSSVVEIVSLEGKLFTRLYKCSPTQRWYEWGQMHTKDMWDDLASIMGNDSARHSFNTILCGTQNPHVVVKDFMQIQLPELLLTDGQQRLTTFMILMNCIRIACIIEQEKAPTAPLRSYFQEKATDLGKKLFYKREIDCKMIPRLQLLDGLDEYWQNYILNPANQRIEIPAGEHIEGFTLAHERLKGARDRFDASIVDLLVQGYDKLQSFIATLQQADFTLETASETNVILNFNRFLTLNARGCPISDFDKLKNVLCIRIYELSADDSIFKDEMRPLQEYFKKIYMLVAKSGELSRSDELEIVKLLCRLYTGKKVGDNMRAEQQIGQSISSIADAKLFLRYLLAAVCAHADCFNPYDQPSDGHDVSKLNRATLTFWRDQRMNQRALRKLEQLSLWFKRIHQLNAHAYFLSWCVAFYVRRVKEHRQSLGVAMSATLDNMIYLASNWEKLYFRKNVIKSISTNQEKVLWIQYWKMVENGAAPTNIRQYLNAVNNTADIDAMDFRERSKLQTSESHRRYFLAEYEKFLRPTVEFNVWKDTKRFWIEHMLPVNRSRGGDAIKYEFEEVREKFEIPPRYDDQRPIDWIHRLGNQLLIEAGYNSSFGDKPLSQKCPSFSSAAVTYWTSALRSPREVIELRAQPLIRSAIPIRNAAAAPICPTYELIKLREQKYLDFARSRWTPFEQDDEVNVPSDGPSSDPAPDLGPAFDEHFKTPANSENTIADYLFTDEMSSSSSILSDYPDNLPVTDDEEVDGEGFPVDTSHASHLG